MRTLFTRSFVKALLRASSFTLVGWTSVARADAVQLENGASRLYLGVHFGFDNWQGQLLGSIVAHAVLDRDLAALGARAPDSATSVWKLSSSLLARPDLYGVYGRSTEAR
jgi:hypothetical protein